MNCSPSPDRPKAMLDVHCSLAALVKDSKGEVVQKLTRDRQFHVTPEQLKLGNFLDKMTVTLPPGKYTLETAVIDGESGKVRDAAFGIRSAGQSRRRRHFFPRPHAFLHAQRQGARPRTKRSSSRVAASRPLWIRSSRRDPTRCSASSSPCIRTLLFPPRPRWRSSSSAEERASPKSRCSCLPPTRRAEFPT